MTLRAQQLGWLDFPSDYDAEVFNSEIDTCMGFPTADGQTLTWADTRCMFDGSSYHYLIIITDEITNCLTQEQKDSIIQIQENWIDCFNISGTTENYVGS